ncbi:MAG: hypothetical protein H6981_06125 [Gammaproteobacteria bacterium]|nr:hypothetical protein [Gammaproteobacteria bacterium]MCP5136360.1 hypothetical protein [Gammaproteobacteria bacterium]
MELIYIVAGLFFAWVALVAGWVAWKIFTADRGLYQSNRERYRSWWNGLTGRVPTKHDGIREPGAAAGLAVNRHGKWIENGTLSDESIDLILK